MVFNEKIVNIIHLISPIELKHLDILNEGWGAEEQQNEIMVHLPAPILLINVAVQRFGQIDASNAREFRELSSFSVLRRPLKTCVYKKLFCLGGFVVTSKISSIEETKAECLS